MVAPSSNKTPPGLGAASEVPRYSPITPSAVHAAVQQGGYSLKYVDIAYQALDEFQLILSSAHDGQLLKYDIPAQAENSPHLHLDRYCENEATKPGQREYPINSDRDSEFNSLLFLTGGLVRTLLDEFLCIINPNPDIPLLGSSPIPRGPEYGDGLPDGIEFGTLNMDGVTEDKLIPSIDSLEMVYEVQEIIELAFHIYVTEPGFADAISTPFHPHVPVIAVRTASRIDLVMAEPGPYTVPLSDEGRAD
jgi:hypothetical protein